jgi:transcriptional antiterminator
MIINTKEWITQAQLAKKLGCTRQNIQNQIAKKKFKTLFIEEWNLLLVENRSSLKINQE